MTSVIPVHSALRAIALACWGSNPAVRKMSRVISVARSAASFRFSCSSSSCAAAECARSTPDQGFQQPLELGPPRRVRVDVHVDLAPDLLGHALEQVFLAAEMPVQGHRRDAQVLGELADGQRVEPVGVGELERALGHGALAEPGTLAVRLF